MGIWQWISRRRQETAVAEIAHRAAALVSESIRPVVEKRIVAMGLHEARGYVRARAGHLIDEAVAMVTAYDRPTLRPSTEVVKAATIEEVVQAVLRRPAPLAVRTRRAA
jgi:hypothetical protein